MNRPNQQLRSELQDIAQMGEEAAHVIWQVVKTLPEDQIEALMQAIGLVHECVDKAHDLANRVKAGGVVAV
ncbi:hypothetical protein PKB_3357 [Pseudomonas knackmussii B13]|uniref:Uncharacterized protein n=1 Tax=Pseudomonas knackmussii (strain DSM 6978 / CCUG 54928 / LMG 23759 / B13) TaxID=1301098 RepID=A0A024HIJ8_PSEKB|nr:hypothetical protein [Pseudomonas knackmussii]CDF84701.1 hypothetical protein PKB_3357 [Pseudomonas knackmussii B13]